MRSDRAMMAVCEVLLPTSVAKPSTLRLSSCAVLEGVRSWLMMMHGSLRCRRSLSSSTPSRLLRTRDRDVAHVGGAFAQVIVVNGRQGRRVAFGDRVERVLRVDLLRLDDAHDLVEQRAVFQHEQMRVEDAAFLGAHAFADLALDVQDLLTGLHQRPLQPVDLLGQLRIGELAPGNRRTRPAEHEDLAAAHPGGNRDATEGLLVLRLQLWHGRFLSKLRAAGKQFLGKLLAIRASSLLHYKRIIRLYRHAKSNGQ